MSKPREFRHWKKLALAALVLGASACVSDPVVSGDPVPVVTSFGAQPASIAAGESSYLAWNVTGATTIFIDQGVGTVTGTTVSVSPSATTTYTLIAASAAGTATATVTVTGGGTIGTCNSTATQLFPAGAPWNLAIDGAALDTESTAIIAYVTATTTPPAPGSRSLSTSTSSSPTAARRTAHSQGQANSSVPTAIRRPLRCHWSAAWRVKATLPAPAMATAT